MIIRIKDNDSIKNDDKKWYNESCGKYFYASYVNDFKDEVYLVGLLLFVLREDCDIVESSWLNEKRVIN